jgi:hypothetical protein
MSAEDHLAEPQNSECGAFLSLHPLNFCCPEIEKLCRSPASADHQIDQVFRAVDAAVSGDLCRCFLQGLSVLLSLDLLASEAFVAGVTFATFRHTSVGSPGSSPELADRELGRTGGADKFRFASGCHDVSRLCNAVPGLQKWDKPSQKHNLLSDVGL